MSTAAAFPAHIASKQRGVLPLPVREHLPESFRARRYRGGQGWRTRVSSISKPTGVTKLALQCFDLATAHKLNLMGNELTAKVSFVRRKLGG